MNELEKKKEETTKVISELLEDINTKIFSFTLSKKQVELLNNYNNKIRILHLSEAEWKKFTEEFVYNTNAIEGSTVTQEEVPEILNKEIVEKTKKNKKQKNKQ